MATFVRHMRDHYRDEDSEAIARKEILLNLDNVDYVRFSNNIYSDPIAIVYLSSGVRLDLLANKDNIMTGSDTEGYTA